MSNTKAIHLRNFKQFILARGGSTAWVRVLEPLTPQERESLSQTIVITAWIDCRFWWRLLQVMDHTLGNGDLRTIREFGYYDAQENLKGAYKMLFALIKTEALIRLSPLIWRLYYDTGSMQVARAAADGGEIRLVGFPDLPAGHEIEIIGWLEGALALMKVKEVRITHPGPCLARGDAYCSYVGQWR